MKNYKKIDEVYREKFRGVETTPPADVWEHIEAHLPEKGKRRISPFWWPLGGVAAALILFAMLTSPFKNSAAEGQTTIVFSEPDTHIKIDITSDYFTKKMQLTSVFLKAAIQETQKKALAKNNKETLKNKSEEKIHPVSKNIGRIAGTSTSNNPKNVSGTSKISEVNSTESKQNNSSEKGIANSSPQTPVIQKSEITSKKELAAISSVVMDSLKNKSDKTASENSLALENNKKSEKEKETDKNEGNFSRFSIGTVAGAVYSDKLGSDSPAGTNVPGNSGNGEVSFAYGINFGYRLTQKLKIRSGISKVNINYKSSNINYLSAVSVFQPNPDLAAGSSGELNSGFGDFNVGLNQQLSFFEVPVEIEYNLINKNIGLNLITGISTLFLNQNNLTLMGPDFLRSGESTNLNNTSFTANLGLGIDYDFAPKLQLNIEPVFKYQLNTFNNSGSINPYYFGVYTGLRYKF